MAAKILFDPSTLHLSISQLLQQAGWQTDDSAQVMLGIPLNNYTIAQEPLIHDYCLYRENGQVLAIIEVNFTCKNLETGQYKVLDYVNQLEKQQLLRPFAFQTNGHEVYLWHEATSSMQLVNGFLSRQFLEDRLQHIPPSQKQLWSGKTVSDADEDKDLWHAFKQGDYAAFTRIYKKNVQPLYNFGCKLTTDHALVEDSIHDLFVELWKNRQQLSEVYAIKYYLFKALKRKIIRSLGKKSAQYALLDDYNFECIFSHEFALITSQINQQQEKSLATALSNLSDRQREAIFLRFYEGFSYEEIASVMAITVKTAYNFVYMALSELRKNLIHLIPALLLLCNYPFLL